MTSPARAYNDQQGLRRYNVEGLAVHPLSVTTLIKSIAPGSALSSWVDKKLISAALDAYAKTGDQEVALQVGKQARWSGSEAADFGTSVHALTEKADLKSIGKPQDSTPVADQKKAAGFVAQWEKTRDAFDIQIIAVECTLVNRELGYAGTADRIVVVPALSPDPVVLDIKSGKGIYADVALQCAALANCDEILYNDGTLAPIPWKLNRQYGVAAHVRARSCKLIPLDLEIAWPIFKPLPQLALWRAEHFDVLGEALLPDEIAQRRADLRLRINKLPPDLKKVVKGVISVDESLGGGNTTSWDEDQLLKVEFIFIPFEHEARERIEKVLDLWGDRGELELRVKLLDSTGGKTSSINELTAPELDSLLATF